VKQRDLQERWKQDDPIISRGITLEGLADYRGLQLPAISKGLAFHDADLTFLRAAGGVLLEGSTFSNCRFRQADLKALSETQNVFAQCRFEKATFTGATLGGRTSRYKGCSFIDCVMSNVICSNAVFSECEFVGTFKDIDFGASGFWDCTFKGTVQDIWIRGDYSFEMLRSIHRPVETVLHHVDFIEATLSGVTFSDHCQLVDLSLPSHAALVDVGRIGTDFLDKAKIRLSKAAAEEFAFTLNVHALHSVTQRTIMITRQDLAGCGDEVDEAFSLLAEVSVDTPSS
jgi:uncharacterized protein YjbI with pentapeptide repeats